MWSIRQAGPGDALGAAIVNVYTWQTAYAGLLPQEMLRQRILGLTRNAAGTRRWLENGGAGLVAEESGAIVGMCLYGGCRSDEYPGGGEITALYVLDGFQGQGVGKALFRAAVRRLRAAGYTSMVIHCLCGNPSLEFYRHMGGTVTAQREDRIGGAALQTDVVYYPDLDALGARPADE